MKNKYKKVTKCLSWFVFFATIVSMIICFNQEDGSDSARTFGIITLIGLIVFGISIMVFFINNGNELNENYKHSKEIQKDAKLRALQQSAKDGVKCPKCGSTQIQVVKRGWNIATGFLENNQVDRVCLNCKHRW